MCAIDPVGDDFVLWKHVEKQFVNAGDIAFLARYSHPAKGPDGACKERAQVSLGKDRSDFLFATMRDLISRSSLITAIYRNTDRFNCGPDEHAEIVKAISAKAVEKAVHLMAHHLEHVESELDLSEIRELSYDLRTALT